MTALPASGLPAFASAVDCEDESGNRRTSPGSAAADTQTSKKADRIVQDTGEDGNVLFLDRKEGIR